MISSSVFQSQPVPNLKLTLLLETLTSGQVVASIFEFPGCRVEADNRETAIAQLQADFLERLKHIEVIPWNVPAQSAEPAWMQFAGVFENDSDFQAIMAAIRSERTTDDDSEVDPSYYL